MLKTCSTVAALALTAVLATAADAQAPPRWTQAGMLRCVVNPSIGFIIAGHQSMECTFTQNAPIPPQAYQGALNMIGLNIGISAGGGSPGPCWRQRLAYRPARSPANMSAHRATSASVSVSVPTSWSEALRARSRCSRSPWKVRWPSTWPLASPHSNCGRRSDGRCLSGEADVRFGSKPDIHTAKSHVRFTPESGHVRCNPGCPLWAKSGHSEMSVSSSRFP